MEEMWLFYVLLIAIVLTTNEFCGHRNSYKIDEVCQKYYWMQIKYAQGNSDNFFFISSARQSMFRSVYFVSIGLFVLVSDNSKRNGQIFLKVWAWPDQ